MMRLAAAKGMDEILPNLFLGNAANSRDLKNLQENKITHILVVGSGLQQNHPLKFKYHQIQIEDMPSVDIFSHFEKCFEFIEEAHKSGGVVFVHCLAGISRSSSVIIGFLMFKNKLTFEQAYEHVKSKRYIISPNEGFRKQLVFLQEIAADFKSPLIAEFIANIASEAKKEREFWKSISDKY
eukprot:TRINITY_DN2938_c0_g1_i1.p1 TRINITY_DN2938_c0_g1~~TRINITY_DN2938_c0_g1_i1.p1  ORF type:complete len:182 (+),score=48.81 TRINITY_DN2938_c0_g1_i1:174-719(+)